jgi:alpha-methylacyl-CoA racemase
LTGPLAGLRVVELAGIGPTPFAAMLLADLGAEVIRVERPGATGPLGTDPTGDLLNRSRRSIAVDLKSSAGRELVLRLVSRSDVLLEGFRPGVAERLGLGPADCSAVNEKLVYGRMTGWGQSGPLASAAGHDIDYIAVTGALWATGRPPDRPVPPLNLVGDFGGGALFLVVGVLAALLECARSGQGQTVDAAMVDGTAVLTTMFWSLRNLGMWGSGRGSNLLDGGAPFYDVYECADGRFLAVGALEPQFYADLVSRTDFDDGGLAQYDVSAWPELRKRFTALFASRPRDEWVGLLEGTDACAAPVLSWDEAPSHPQLAARSTFVDVDGVTQPAPAPRFSRSVPDVPRPPRAPGADTDDVLRELGLP